MKKKNKKFDELVEKERLKLKDFMDILEKINQTEEKDVAEIKFKFSAS
ncbi:MAG: hypothetical protein IB618_04120 [Candidatus Pacearchaeota archaeon]|nr:MAG: hypothetical protein IB618_04120 [Candidatus Pacearchaeota archaeon]